MPQRQFRLKTLFVLALVGAWLVAVFATGASRAMADEPLGFQQLIDQFGKSIVTVKYITKLSVGGRGAGNETEIDSEVFGVMIDPKGLVVCSNTQLDGFTGMIKRMTGGMAGLSITSDINTIKVLVGPDEQEMDAEILARDNELDLAWIEIKKPEGTYDAIDFAQDHSPALGDKLVSVHRLGKHFDRAPVVQTGVVCGQTTKPRKLWITQDPFTNCLGLPVFTATGKLVGIAILQIPSADEDGAGESQMISRLMSMMSSQQGQQDMHAVLLPAADVVKATARARVAGAAKPAKEKDADKDDDAKKDEDKKEEKKDDDN